jgi:hypothetical protein
MLLISIYQCSSHITPSGVLVWSGNYGSVDQQENHKSQVSGKDSLPWYTCAVFDTRSLSVSDFMYIKMRSSNILSKQTNKYTK